jgi:hypothetical protein
MGISSKPRPQVAFLAAALVLLVMPVLALFGLSALGLAAGILASMNRAVEGTASWLLLALFISWVVLVVGVVLLLVARLTRRTTTS